MNFCSVLTERQHLQQWAHTSPLRRLSRDWGQWFFGGVGSVSPLLTALEEAASWKVGCQPLWMPHRMFYLFAKPDILLKKKKCVASALKQSLTSIIWILLWNNLPSHCLTEKRRKSSHKPLVLSEARKQLLIYRLPQVLRLHLKRFRQVYFHNDVYF